MVHFIPLQVHFILPISFVLKFTFDRAAPYENVALSLVVL